MTERLVVCVMAAAAMGMPCPSACGAEPAGGFINHGVAAPVSESRGAMAIADAAGRPIILAMALDVYNGAARTSLVVIDTQTGETRQFWYPNETARSEANYYLMVSSKGLFYIMLGNAFLEFDPNRLEWTFAKDMGLGTAMALTEGPDGTIYAGTYPDSHLLAFNPEARECVHLGQLDPAEKYPFSLAVDAAGWLYAGIGTARANLVAFNLDTKQHRPLVDDGSRGTGSAVVHMGEDGHVYGRLPGQPWLRLEDGKAVEVGEPSPKARTKSIRWGAIFSDLPDGKRLAAFDLPGKSFTIIDAQGRKTSRTFDYASAGAGITSMIAGPGGKVYGSTCHPFRLFACDTETGAIENLGGLKKVGGGNFCGLAVLDESVYGAAYCGGWLYAFDTTRPWRDSGDENANPQVVAQFNPQITRPRMALALPDVRHVVYVGFPGYGHVGGGMGFYDAETRQATLLENDAILPGHSTVTLRALPDGTLVGGTSIDAPGGAHTVAQAGRLYLMDYPSRKVLFDIEPVSGAQEINCIEVGPDGKVYGIASTAKYFVFDPTTRAVVHRGDLSQYGGPLRPDQSLLTEPDGRLYALLSRTLVMITTEDYTARPIAELPASATAGTAICGGRVYYAAGSRVWSCLLEP